MTSWHDYITTDALLPAAGGLVATIVGIHSLWSPNVPKRRLLAIVMYAVITIGVAAWYDYSGVETLRSGHDMNRSVQTLLALSGVSSKDRLGQGLDRLITGNLPPRQIIPTQEEELANAFALIKGSLPNPLFVTKLTGSTDDWWQIALPVQRALARNGIQAPIVDQLASSPQDTGLMFTMPDPANPPDYALKLRDAFGLAGIVNIRL